MKREKLLRKGFEEDPNLLLKYLDEININSLKDFFEEYIIKEGPLQAITFISGSSPIEIFEDNKLRNYKFQVHPYKNFWKIPLKRIIEREKYKDGYRTVEGFFILYENKVEDVWTAITYSGREFYNLGLKRFLEAFSPKISIAYLSSNEMRRLFESLQEKLDKKISAEKAILYSHKREGNISYEEKPIQNVFNKAKNENKFVDKIKFSIPSKEKDFEGYITREGGTRYYYGDNKLYFNIVIEFLANLISDKGELFSGRARDYESKKSKPLQIKFNKGTIESKRDNLEIIKALSDVRKSSLVVYHKNPYLHASLLDYEDGSSADIFIASDDKISIIPSFRASRSSLMKICDKITQKFREGNVEDKKPTRKKFNDYFR